VWEKVEGSFAVGGAGVGVSADGVESGVAEHVGYGDQVGAAMDRVVAWPTDVGPGRYPMSMCDDHRGRESIVMRRQGGPLWRRPPCRDIAERGPGSR